MAVSLSVVHSNLRDWISGLVRIDRWTIDEPSATSTDINGIVYPANTANLFPASNIRFSRSDFGALCEADFFFKIVYRFTKLLKYDDLPIELAEGVINNLYYLALSNSGDIHPDIKNISTPDIGTDVVVRPVADAGSDWLVILQPSFRIEFLAGLADLSGLQPVDPDTPTEFNKLDIAIYRAKVNDFDTNRLDRTLTITED